MRGLLVLTISAFLSYLVGAFIVWNADPSEWSEGMRAASSLSFVFFSMILSSLTS